MIKILMILFLLLGSAIYSDDTTNHRVTIEVPAMRVLYLDESGDIGWIWNLGNGFSDSDLRVHQNGIEIPMTQEILNQYHTIMLYLTINGNGWYTVTPDMREQQTGEVITILGD